MFCQRDEDNCESVDRPRPVLTETVGLVESEPSPNRVRITQLWALAQNVSHQML